MIEGDFSVTTTPWTKKYPKSFDEPPATQEGHWLPKLAHRLTTFVDWESRGLPVWSAFVELLYPVALGLQVASRVWCKRTKRAAAISDDLFALRKFIYAFMELIQRDRNCPWDVASLVLL
jgi:hypothetical protein